MKNFRRSFAILAIFSLVLSLFAGLVQNENAQAAAKPGKPVISVKTGDEGKSAVITIGKTKDAQGYKIMVKKPGAKKFTKLATISEDGTAKRTYTAKKLTEGEYQFKVRAYLKNGKKTVWGKYSKVAKVTVKAVEKEAKVKLDPKVAAVLDENYPELKVLAEAGEIGVTVKTEDEAKEYITLGKWNYERMSWKYYPDAECELYDVITDSKATPMEWQILEYSADGKKALVLSRYVIGHLAYDDEWREVTWETCSARKWLNETFFEKAFSEDEQKLIESTKLKNSDNPETGTKGGNDTEDRIFYLSLEEATKYFPTPEGIGFSVYKYLCTSIDGQVCSWYLRTPGYSQEAVSSYEGTGCPNAYGFGTGQQEFCVRPAFWITLTPEIIENNNLSLSKGKKAESELSIEDLCFTFGSWAIPSMDRNKNPIQWQLLDYDKKNGKILLLSRYSVDNTSFDESNIGSHEQNLDVYWEDCTLRKWLNEKFYDGAFSAAEKARIINTTLTNKGSKDYGKKDGKDTKDNVFLLSQDEAELYFDHSKGDWAANRVLERPDGSIDLWFLRSPGNKNNTAAYVNEFGCADPEPGANIASAAVRPAIWISLK
ncbi:MAG: fibronectin type III domain-containing protein [Lachnospiraceae bacterium]|nr:fibronectin type III domain-containing protein [Lachnospiraceae bacterium]